jgi:hypothetical protein
VRFFEYASEKLKLKKTSDWANVTVAEVAALGGAGLLKRYGSSLINGTIVTIHANILLALKAVYPQYPWETKKSPSQFSISFWSDKQSVKSFLDELARDLGITSKEDWYKVSSVELYNVGVYNAMYPFPCLKSTIYLLIIDR